MGISSQSLEPLTLSSLREAVGLSRTDLANYLGVTVQTVGNWETARSFPKLTVSQVFKMLSVLPCSLEELAAVCDEIERQFREKHK